MTINADFINENMRQAVASGKDVEFEIPLEQKGELASVDSNQCGSPVFEPNADSQALPRASPNGPAAFENEFKQYFSQVNNAHTASIPGNSYSGQDVNFNIPLGQSNPFVTRPYLPSAFGVQADAPFSADHKEHISLSNGYTYFFDESGLHGMKPGKKSIFIHVCSPFTIPKALVDEHGVEIAKQISIGCQSAILKIQDMRQSFKNCLKVLEGKGLRMKGHPHAAHLLQVFLQEFSAQKNAFAITRSGWHQQYDFESATNRYYFGLPWFIASPEGVPPPVYLGSDNIVSRYESQIFPWREHVGIHCRGNTRLVFAIVFAMSSVFFKDFGLDGCILHFFGPSSKGKSTILEVVASLDPEGRKKCFLNWRTTANGLEILLEIRNDYYIVVDEIAQISTHDLDAAVYMIGNGQGKIRRTGSQQVAKKPFRVAVISSGETSIRSALATKGRKQTGGQAVRAIDLPAMPDNGEGIYDRILQGFSPAQFSQYLKKAAQEAHKNVMSSFLNMLVSNKDSAIAAITKDKSRMMQELLQIPLDAQAERVSQYFALAGAVGEYAIACGILPFAIGEAFSSAHACFQAWLENHSQNTLSEEARIHEHLAMILRQHRDNRFLEYHGGNRKNLDGAYGYRQDKGSLTEYILPKEGFEKMFSGFDPDIVRRELKRTGRLQTAGRDSQVYRTLPGSGRTKCTVIIVESTLFPESDHLPLH